MEVFLLSVWTDFFNATGGRSLSCPIQKRKMVICDAQIDFWHEGGRKTFMLTFLKDKKTYNNSITRAQYFYSKQAAVTAETCLNAQEKRTLNLHNK